MFAGVVCNPRPARRNEKRDTKSGETRHHDEEAGASDSTVSSGGDLDHSAAGASPRRAGSARKDQVSGPPAAVGRRATSKNKEEPLHCTTGGFYDQFAHLAA